MAVWVYADNITSTTATIVIAGLDTTYSTKQIRLLLDSQQQFVSTFLNVGSSWQTNLANLSPNNSYRIDVQVAYYDWATGDYIYEGQDYCYFDTLPLSGDPTYYVTVSGDSVTVNVDDLPNNIDEITYYLYNDDQSLVINYYTYSYSRIYNTFSSLSDGTYYIKVQYTNQGITRTIDNQDNPPDIWTQVIINTGGGGGSDWNYDNSYNIAMTSNNTSEIINVNTSGYDGVFIHITTDSAGQLDIVSSYESGNFKVYIGTIDNGYDLDGIPISYDSDSVNNISVSYNPCALNYYIWIKSRYSTDNSSCILSIDFTPASQGWSYSYTYTNTSVTFNVSYPPPNIYYYVYRVGTSSGSYDIYDTDTALGNHESVSSKTISNLSPSTTYYINAGYSTSIDGVVTWLGQNHFTTSGTPSGNGYVYIFTGSRWQRAKPYIFNGSNWQPATAYIFNGSTWKKTTS